MLKVGAFLQKKYSQDIPPGYPINMTSAKLNVELLYSNWRSRVYTVLYLSFYLLSLSHSKTLIFTTVVTANSLGYTFIFLSLITFKN